MNPKSIDDIATEDWILWWTTLEMTTRIISRKSKSKSKAKCEFALLVKKSKLTSIHLHLVRKFCATHVLLMFMNKGQTRYLQFVSWSFSLSFDIMNSSGIMIIWQQNHGFIAHLFSSKKTSTFSPIMFTVLYLLICFLRRHKFLICFDCSNSINRVFQQLEHQFQTCKKVLSS